MDPRGQDSWGAWADGQEWKGLGLAAHGAPLAELAKAKRVLIHTRKATIGSVTVENSHPFSFTGDAGSFTGIHNGSVANHRALNSKLDRKLDVDSMHIYQHMAEGRDLGELEVRGAVAWVHAEEAERMYFSRLKGGALAVAGILASDKVGAPITDTLFGSLPAGIRAACLLAACPWTDYIIKDDTRYYIADGLTYHDTPEQEMGFGKNPIEFTYSNSHYGRAASFPTAGGSRAFGTLALRNFLRDRDSYLEGYHGDEACSMCSVTASVKAKLTGLRYCLTCWGSWEQLAAFKQMQKSGAKFKADVGLEEDDEELPDGAVCHEIPCEWGCDSEPASYIVWSKGMQDAYFVCNTCVTGAWGSTASYKTLALRALQMNQNITWAGKSCDSCHKDPGICFFKPRVFQISREEKWNWLCLECLRWAILLDEDELEDVRIIKFPEQAKKVNCDAAKHKYVGLRDGTVQRIEDEPKVEPDVAARERIREHLTGEIKPLVTKLSARKEGLKLAEPSEMDTRSGGFVHQIFEKLFPDGESSNVVN